MASWFNGENYKLSASLDIGTTSSGYAYSFRHHEENIMGVVNHKMPTAVLINKDGHFEAFGCEALERYKKLDKNELQMYSLFEKFKMQLMKTRVSVVLIMI